MTEKEFKKRMHSISTNQRVSNNDVCYILNDNLVYERQSKSDNAILSIISSFLLDSWENLDKDEQKEIKTTINGYNKIFENVYSKAYIAQFVTKFTRDDIKFDLYFKQIHFINGYVNLETKKVCKRVVGKYFITKCIAYNYTKPKKQIKNKGKELLKELKKDISKGTYIQNHFIDIRLCNDWFSCKRFILNVFDWKIVSGKKYNIRFCTIFGSHAFRHIIFS